MRPSTTAPDHGISLYIHIPFCLSKCPYCDFNTYQGIETQFGDFLTAVCAELDAWFRVLAHPAVNTVFLGGGTPSYLPAGAVARILDTVAAGAGRLPADAEITAECNPNDLTPARCADLRAAGVNRISIGVQSMDNALLTMLGRRHDAAEAAAALRHCRRAGFDNISLDLMYGLPRQTLRQWQDTLHAALSLSPEHLSLYALTLEDGTPLRRWVTEGRLPEPDPDLAADMYDHARRALSAAGYGHYEISNWAFPGRQSRHNLAYWRNGQWLGVGPGAHSALAGIRFWTVRSPRDYAARARRWAAELTATAPAGSVPSDRIAPASIAPDGAATDRIAPGSVSSDQETPPPGAAWPEITEAAIAAVPTVAGYEVIDPATAAAETMFLGLRLQDGIDLAEASAQTGADLPTRYRQELAELTADGLLHWESPTRVRLDESAWLTANQVFARFL